VTPACLGGVLVCREVTRWPDAAKPGGAIRKCATCSADVHVAPTSLLLLADDPSIAIACDSCGLREMSVPGHDIELCEVPGASQTAIPWFFANVVGANGDEA
jgi:DNA-directed RNA polymerase subunit RPC12/RpoP